MELRAVVLCCALLCCAVSGRKGRKLVVVLVDGVRWDYLKDPELKGFKRMAEKGVRAPYVVPVFPSLSYPNWLTLETGLYPELHGFVDNYLYDNETGRTFDMIPEPDSTNPIWWNDAEPVWVTAEKRNKPAALYWWGGCEVEIMGTHPTICERNRFGPQTEEEKIDFLERIDDMVNMFKPSKRFDTDRLSLAMMYYGSVDYAGHHFGSTSRETKNAMRDIDDILDKMQDKFKKAGLEKEVNIMVLSDHGMTDTKSHKHIDLQPFAHLIQLQVSSGATAMIVPRKGSLDKLYDDIVAAKIPGLEVYKKDSIPEKYHIKHSRRTQPLFLKAKPGFLISKVKDPGEIAAAPSYYFVANHGFDPEEVPDMNTVFLATGPDFKAGYETKALENVDLYNVMCSVLGFRPLPNNGSWSRVRDMLHNQDDPSTTAPSDEYESLSTSTSSSDRLCLHVCTKIATLWVTLYAMVVWRAQ